MPKASTSTEPGGPVLALLALICLAGAAVRFGWLGQEGFWLDEMITGAMVLRGEHSLAAVVEATFHADVHPPLYYLLVSLWARLFGDSEAALRAFSALVGSLTAPAAIWVFRRHLRGSGLVVLAALFASVPIVFEPTQQARTYPLLILVATLAAGCLLDLVCRPHWDRHARRGLAWLTLILLLGCWLHYFGLVIAIGAGAVLVARWRRDRRALAEIALAGVIGLLGILPWLVPHAILNAGRLGPGGTWIDPVPTVAMEALLFGLLGRPWPLALISGAALALAAAGLSRITMSEADRRRLRGLTGFFLGMLFTAMLGAVLAPSLSIRTVAALAPPLLAAAALLAQLGLAHADRGRRYAFGLLVTLVIVVATVSSVRYAITPRFPQWRESARLVLAWPGCRDAEIATYELYHPVDYYRARFAPGATFSVVELYGDKHVTGRFLRYMRRRSESGEDCPVIFWGNTTAAGFDAVTAALTRRYPELRPVRFRKILLLVAPDAAVPPGFRSPGG
jgi:4-amino-4-deoxy-L-arabinose transferase-like glycosyltransferase